MNAPSGRVEKHANLSSGNILICPRFSVKISFHWKYLSETRVMSKKNPPDEAVGSPKPVAGRPSSAARQYHHGTLREAMLQAAEAVLRREGLNGLTLRAIAREAGVSHTASQHHFGDMAGVLSELAAIGHQRLAASMERRAAGVTPELERQLAIARGYIDFALANPDLFRLMSRNELLDAARPSLVEACQRSSRGLAGVFDAGAQDRPATANVFGHLSPDQAIEMTAAWGYVHGLASLLIDGHLAGLSASSGTFADPLDLVDAVLDRIRLSFMHTAN
jgi:AcrR family transcriptional regulator